MSTTDTLSLPDYAPVPRSAIGPALNEQGYYVGRVERNLYWVTDGTYQSAFLTTSDGVVAARRAAHDRPQHPARGRRDRRRQRRQQQGQLPHLLAPPRRPRRRVLAVRQERHAHRPRGDATPAAARRRPGAAPQRGDLRGPPHARDRRRAHRPGLARRQPLARQHHHPPARPRHADADRHRQPGLGADVPLEPDRGHPRLHRGAGERARLLVEALHRRSPRPARHPRGRDACTSSTWRTSPRAPGRRSTPSTPRATS